MYLTRHRPLVNAALPSTSHMMLPGFKFEISYFSFSSVCYTISRGPWARSGYISNVESTSKRVTIPLTLLCYASLSELLGELAIPSNASRAPPALHAWLRPKDDAPQEPQEPQPSTSSPSPQAPSTPEPKPRDPAPGEPFCAPFIII